MTLNNILNTSLSGLFANQTALRTTSNNIANVNTEDYSRLRVSQEANVLQGQSVGVQISGIERVVDEFLASALRSSDSSTAEYTIQAQFHDRLQGLLGNPDSDSSMTAQIDDIFTAVADLTLNPADTLRRQQVLTEVKTLLDRIDLLQGQLQDLRAEASAKIGEDIENINEILVRIHELNPLLIRQKAQGGETGGLEGQMDQALGELADYVDINVRRTSNGGVVVTTGSGIPLVDTSLHQFEYETPGVVGSDTVFPRIELFRVDDETLAQLSSGTDMSTHLRSGELKGLVDLRDEQLVDLTITLGEMSARIADEFNRVHNQFTPVPPPNTMTGRDTFVDGGHPTGFTGIVTFAVTDANGDLVNSTTVDFDGAPPADFNALIAQVNAGLGGDGTLALTNGVMSLTATNAANGVAIADDATTPSDRAGRGFSHFFGMNDLIVADERGIYDTGLTGTEDHNLGAGETIGFSVRDASGRELTQITVTTTGTTFNDMIGELNNVAGLGAYFTFTLDSLGNISRVTNAPFSDLSLNISSESTNLGGTGVSFSEAFGLTDRFRIDASKDIQLRPDIQNDPDALALSQFDHTAAVGDNALTDGDQRGALALQEIETLQVSFADAGELKSTNVSLGQYVARFLGNTGLMASRARDLEDDNMALSSELSQRKSDLSGVNMDEELSNLIVYQNAYNAAARMLTSVQELYDALLQSV